MNVIGCGRIGSYIAKVSKAKTFSRSEKLADFEAGPIVIATRNDDLEKILKEIPKNRFSDLVFIQNGMYQPVLDKYGISECTKVLIYFAIQNKGDKPVDGKGTVVTGKHGISIKQLLNKNEIDASLLKEDQFNIVMFEKLLWNCVFGLLCRVYNKNVGDLVQAHRDEIEKLTEELSAIIAEKENVQMPFDTSEKLCDYSMKISDYIGDVKEWSWRNGWFWDYKQTDLHSKLLGLANLDFNYQ